MVLDKGLKMRVIRHLFYFTLFISLENILHGESVYSFARIKQQAPDNTTNFTFRQLGKLIIVECTGCTNLNNPE